MLFFCRLSKRLATGEAGIEIVPKADGVFTIAPAQIDNPITPSRWKVDETRVNVPQFDAKSLDGEYRFLHPPELGQKFARFAAAAIANCGFQDRQKIGASRPDSITSGSQLIE